MKRFGMLLCAMLVVLAAVFAPVSALPASADEAYFLSWDEYKEAKGIGSWNYNDIADAIESVADHALELYGAGSLDEAYDFAKATYWGYYETTGFERNTMNYISGARVSEVELAFSSLRKAVKKDKGTAAVQEAADHLMELLRTDAMILSPDGSAAAAEASERLTPDALPEYFLAWEDYQAAYGVTSWNYNDLAQAIDGVANHALELYKEGSLDEAYDFAKATYWGYYETSGFERNTMNYISGARVSEVELAFSTLRKAVKKDKGAEAVQEAADHLTEMLYADAQVLSPGEGIAVLNTGGSGEAPAAENANPASSATGIAVFLGSFGIILREGLEAILIVGAIIAYLVKAGNKKGVLSVYIGSAFAVVCSFIMAGILNYLLSKSAEYHMSQEVIEGIAALTAVAVLFYVSNWMVSKAESASWTRYIESKAASGVSRGSLLTLGFTAWLAVFREGAEVILFYQPMLAEDRPDMVWAGFGVGVAALVVVFLAIRFLSVKIPLKPFFMGTSILMAIMSISFLGAGIKELIEGGVFDNFEWVISSPRWLNWIPYNDVLDVLGIYPLVGTIVPQLILLAITVITFVIHIRRSRRDAAEAA